MKKVEIYSTKICPYCVRAKTLLDSKGAAYTEIDVTNDDALRDKMVARAGGKRSVPQIFIGDKHVGGCDDLYALNSKGELDALLA
jgi:glutaredoxin 3